MMSDKERAEALRVYQLHLNPEQAAAAIAAWREEEERAAAWRASQAPSSRAKPSQPTAPRAAPVATPSWQAAGLWSQTLHRARDEGRSEMQAAKARGDLEGAVTAASRLLALEALLRSQ